MTPGATLRRPRLGACLLALLAGLALLALPPLQAGAQVPVPPLTGHVTDQTGTLTVEQQSALEQKLAAFEASKGTQLAVLMVPSTQPEAIEQYALRVAEVWKLGRKKVDDGLIVVVARDDRAVRIEVGYGLEGAMPDITSKRIIRETMLPRFGQGDFYDGIDAGMDQIMRVVSGEPLPAPPATRGPASQGFSEYAPLLLVLALGVGAVLRSVLGRPAGALVTGGIVSVVAWLLIGTLATALLAGAAAMFFTLVGGGWTHGPGGFMGGLRGPGGRGGGPGGFGGGGFRGGGGGFGGGGASGRW